MGTQAIRTTIAAAFTISAATALCAGAGGTAIANQNAGWKDAPIAGVRVGFALTMAKRNGSTFTCVDTITHQRMASLSVSTNGSVVTALWKGHPKCGANFRVTARFMLLPDGGFEYSGFDWAGNESPFYVHRVSFPEVAVPRTERTAIFRPHAMGEVFRPNWRKFTPGKTVSATVADYLAFNCIATMDDGACSHFLDMRGEARRVSPIAFYVRNGERRGEAVLSIAYAPAMPEGMRSAGTMPFTGVYAPYRGGWYEAAKMHHAWMEMQPWFKAAAARDFSKLREISLWMWGRGGVDVVEEPVKWFMKETGLKVALDWYWWHNVPYDTAYPFFWPPRDGEEAFRASVKRMKEAGAFVQVYTNGMLWDCDDPRWADGGLDCTLIRSDGRVHTLVFNPYTKKRQAWMCGEAPKFQSMMRKLERTLAGTGLAGVYMDMIACAAHMPCCNPRHKHAPGGGTAVIDGYRDYVRKVHEDNPGFILSSETPSESYLDLFEAFILPHPSWERVGYGTLPEHEAVPAVTVIYRDAAVVFGSYATPGGVPAWDPLWGVNPDKPDVEEIVAQYPDQFAVEFVRGVVWGMQPMVHNFTMKDVENPRIAHDIQYMKDTAKFYHTHRDFLFDGTLLKPAALTCATKRTAFLSAGCYTRPKDGKAVVQKALPTVLHSEWRARDGREAVVLANWTMGPQTYLLDFGGGKTVSGTLSAREWRLVNLLSSPRSGEDEHKGENKCQNGIDRETIIL